MHPRCQDFGLSFQLMQKVAEGQRAEISLQLQRALEQISTVSTVLCDIRRHYQEVCDLVNSLRLFHTFHRVPCFIHHRAGKTE